MDPCFSKKMMRRPRKILKDCQESCQVHHRRHPREQGRSRPDQPFAWNDDGSERVDPKTGWKWYDTQQAPSSSCGWQWWQSSSWSQTSKWRERFFCTCQGASLTGNDDSFVSHGECERHTQPARISTSIRHFRTRFFLSWLKGLTGPALKCCVPHWNISSSHPCTTCHTRFPCCFFHSWALLPFHFHLHSSPTYYSTINQTSIDVIFSRRLYLRRSIECVSRSCAWIDFICREGGVVKKRTKLRMKFKDWLQEVQTFWGKVGKPSKEWQWFLSCEVWRRAADPSCNRGSSSETAATVAGGPVCEVGRWARQPRRYDTAVCVTEIAATVNIVEERKLWLDSSVSVDRCTSHFIFLMQSLHNSFHAYHTAWLRTSHLMCL